MDFATELRHHQPTRHQWRTWATREPALADLDRHRLRHELRTSPAVRRDQLLAALLRLTASDRDAGSLLIACLAPGLARLARRARSLDPNDACAIAAAGLWEAIRRHAANPPPTHVAGTLLHTPAWRLQAAVRAEQARRRHTTDGADIPDLPDDRTESSVDDRAGAALLAEAVDASVITRPDAWLLYATRLDGWRLTDAAERLSVNYDAARKRRQRAGHRWAAWSTARQPAASGAAAQPGTHRPGPA